ncbi:MAG: sodium:solute symporter family protein [Holophagales bacterium]|nr:sodium:solute symporter family protein [Holophagales bacterium]
MDNSVLSPSIGWLLLAAFGTGWVALGVYWGRKAKDLDGFMLAGRNVGLALGSATAMATWVTSNTIMLAPKFALQMGIWGMLAYSTAAFGLFLFSPLAFRIRRLMPKGFTSGDFIRLRYGRPAWAIFLLISLVYSMAWLVSMAMAGGIVLEALSGIDYAFGMSVILLVCVIYTLFGGLYAVIGTDFVQSVIILIGVVAVGVVVLGQLDLATIYGHVAAHQPALLDVLMPVALLSLFNNMFFGFGEIFHNNVWWSRAFAMRETVSHRAFLIAGCLWLPIPVAAGFLGLASGALGINIPDPDMAGPLVAGHVLGPIGAVLVFVVVFCSLASSIDSLLAATSDLITEDIYRKMIRPEATERTVRRLGGHIILGLGVVTWLLCLPRFGDLIVVLFLSGPLVASTIWPVAAGIYWPRTNRTGAFLAMLAGSSIGLWAYFTLGWFTASLIGAATSALVVAISTWLRPGRAFDWSRLDESRDAPRRSATDTRPEVTA